MEKTFEDRVKNLQELHRRYCDDGFNVEDYDRFIKALNTLSNTGFQKLIDYSLMQVEEATAAAQSRDSCEHTKTEAEIDIQRWNYFITELLALI